MWHCSWEKLQCVYLWLILAYDKRKAETRPRYEVLLAKPVLAGRYSQNRLN